MNTRFGPWSSALDDGLSPHLSTFWRSRLTQLASVRAARGCLTRRDWLKLGALGAAACALPTLHLASADGPEDAKPALTGKIYVRADFKTGPGADDSESGVFAIDPRTAAWSRICGFEADVRVSRDGRRLALIRAGKSAEGQDIDGVGVWTIDSDGNGEKTRVSDFGGNTSWSPDGKQLIVVKWLGKPSDDEMRSENWRFNADGTGATRLPIPETEAVADWSSDGEWLVTVTDRHPPHGSGYQIYLMRPDGTDERRLTEDQGLNVYPRFSPDSRRIAYLHQQHGLDSLWVVNIDGTGRHEVYREANDTAPDHFCWSPDGKSLAYLLEDWERDEKGRKFIADSEKSNRRIEIMEADGSNRRPLSLPRARWMGEPDWR